MARPVNSSLDALYGLNRFSGGSRWSGALAGFLRPASHARVMPDRLPTARRPGAPPVPSW